MPWCTPGGCLYNRQIKQRVYWPAGTRLTQLYDESGEELSILGEPGSGKTTLLLELARDLLERTNQDQQGTQPLPVIFNLSSWGVKRPPLAQWLVEELNSKYQVPRRQAQTWVAMDQLLLLLDGLDEVAAEHRAACIDAINAYQHEHGLVPLVICSRRADYFTQTQRLHCRPPWSCSHSPRSRSPHISRTRENR